MTEKERKVFAVATLLLFFVQFAIGFWFGYRWAMMQPCTVECLIPEKLR